MNNRYRLYFGNKKRRVVAGVRLIIAKPFPFALHYAVNGFQVGRLQANGHSAFKNITDALVG